MSYSTDDLLTLRAYLLPHHEPMPIVPASKFRDWMDNVRGNYAYRCLPLLMANQAGWVLRNTHRIVCHWDGANGTDGLHIIYPKQKPGRYLVASSNFGHGIVTFHLSYLFRTPPGYNLLVRGLPNHVKAGIQPLEGLIESDWLPMTCTMNWKITHPKEMIVFEEGDPICMIVPQRRYELESFQTEYTTLGDLPDGGESTLEWRQSRSDFLYNMKADPALADSFPWQGNYFRGQMRLGADAEIFEDHQTKLRLALFRPEWSVEGG